MTEAYTLPCAFIVLDTGAVIFYSKESDFDSYADILLAEGEDFLVEYLLNGTSSIR